MCKTMTAMLGTLKVNEVELGGLGKLSVSTVILYLHCPLFGIIPKRGQWQRCVQLELRYSFCVQIR